MVTWLVHVGAVCHEQAMHEVDLCVNTIVELDL